MLGRIFGLGLVALLGLSPSSLFASELNMLRAGVAELAEIRRRFDDIAALATSSTVVMDRFRSTAVLSARDAAGKGTPGVVPRASGLALDARIAHPFTDPGSGFRPVIQSGGDVMARFTVRADEVRASLSLITGLAGQARALSATSPDVPRRGGSGLGITEG